MKSKAFKAAIPPTIPIFFGYLFLGTAFGVLLASKGYNVLWAIFMSVTIYAGSMQFVAVDLITSAFNPVGTIIMTLIVQARHLFYGISLLDKFRNMGKLKPYMMLALTDETYSLQCSVKVPEDVNERTFRFYISLLDHIYWIFGGIVGAVAGTLIKFDSTGIDFAMTALFICIVVEQWEQSKDHRPVLVGIAITLICLIVFKKTLFIPFAMMGILILLSLPSFRKSWEKISQKCEKEANAK